MLELSRDDFERVFSKFPASVKASVLQAARAQAEQGKLGAGKEKREAKDKEDKGKAEKGEKGEKTKEKGKKDKGKEKKTAEPEEGVDEAWLARCVGVRECSIARNYFACVCALLPCDFPFLASHFLSSPGSSPSCAPLTVRRARSCSQLVACCWRERTRAGPGSIRKPLILLFVLYYECTCIYYPSTSELP